MRPHSLTAGLFQIGTAAAILVLTACSRPASTPDSKTPSPSVEGVRAIFPIGGYSGDPERDKKAGFTLAGPVYGTQRDGYLERCEAVGLPYFYPIGIQFDFLGHKGPAVNQIDADEVRREIKAQVAKVVDRDAIVGWYLFPEELRYWMPAELEYLKIASEAITEADPMKRPVWMYEPGHRTHAALAKTFPYQQLVGKGVYPNYSGWKEQREWVPWTLKQQRAAIEDASPNAVPYAILEMFKRPDDQFTRAEIDAWVRHDAYTSLTMGAQGIIIYSFGGRQGFRPNEGEEWNAYYAAWSNLAKEINGPLALGSIVLNGNPMPPPPTRILQGASEGLLLVDKKKPAISVPTLSSTAFKWGSDVYWFLINSSSAPLQIEAPLEGWNPVLEGQPSAKAGEIELPALGVAIFKKQE